MLSTLPFSFKLNGTHLFSGRIQRQFLTDSTNSSSSTGLKFSTIDHCSLKWNSHVCFAFSTPNSSSGSSFSYGPEEEARWLREEQRWLREEQRWLREEARWNTERDALLREIQSLKFRIEELQCRNSVNETSSVSETIANIAKLLQEGELANTLSRIPESGSSALPFIVESAKEDEEVVVKEIVQVPERVLDGEDKQGKKRKTLRTGSEGNEVRLMQEALQKLGFYSGEEDMEFCSFSSGTERAVKTWQSTLGVPEDGIMTAELLERLYMEQTYGSLKVEKSLKESNVIFPDKIANGAAVAAVTDVSEVKEKVLTEDGVSEVEVSHQRVYLLGENRWEEPSRLAGRGKSEIQSGSGETVTKCTSCRGEGRLLCMECDGSGEPNIEPQFLEWVEEGGEAAKCPYCDGLGFVTCDVCEGRKVAEI